MKYTDKIIERELSSATAAYQSLPSWMRSSGGIIFVCLWLIVACCSCEAQLYRRTVKEKCKQVLLFPWRYSRLVLLDDFGIRESIWMAAEYDYLWR